MKNNKDKINWENLSLNRSFEAMELIKEKIKEGVNSAEKKIKNKNVDWTFLSANPYAIDILENNYENSLKGIEECKINWKWLSKNPMAIKLLQKNKNKINWKELSDNVNAINLLKKNKDKIDWKIISKNPAIFTLDN